jgi:integrase
MGRKQKALQIQCEHFLWTLRKRGFVFQADGRGNQPYPGRHSLGERDEVAARKALHQLDRHQAELLGLATPRANNPLSEHVDLEEGRKLFNASISAPEVAGGASHATQARYRAVLDKFVPFIRSRAVNTWNMVTAADLRAYASHLEKEGYAERTLFLELNLVKQVVNFLISQNHLPSTCRISMQTSKPAGSSTYCYTKIEVDTIVKYCEENTEFHWLASVIRALACTGMRIGELVSLRWDDIDFSRREIRVRNDGSSVPARSRRRTKNRKDRTISLNPSLQADLEKRERATDGFAFHGPRGGRLKADTLRVILVGAVLPKVKERLDSLGVESNVERGRLHSFRHFFASECAHNGVPEPLAMTWLGHSSSQITRLYYHSDRQYAERYMDKLALAPAPREATVARGPNEGVEA